MTTPVPGPAASVLSAVLVANVNDPTSPLRVATFSQSGQAPLLPSLANDEVTMPQDGLLDANGTWTGFLSTLGLPGATAPARWVGATASGHPTSGAFSAGDFAVSADGNVYVCTVAGSPGTWIASGSQATGTVGGDLTGVYPNPTVTNTHLATQSVSAAATLGASSAPVVLTDTTTAAFTLTLPATPTANSLFVVVDSTGQWATHTLTIGRNGKNIDGAAANLSLTNAHGKLWLYYDGTGWWSLAAGASNETPVALGTAGPGTSNSLARLNHVHPTTGLVLTSQLPLSRANGGTGVATTPMTPQSFHPANPTATASTTLVMMGLGSTCAFTPASSGKVQVTVTGTVLTNTAAAPITLGGRYGTGTAPANGAAVTGTTFGASTDQSIRAANFAAGVPFALNDVLSLTAGTAYWVDVALDTATAADTAQIFSIGVTAVELS